METLLEMAKDLVQAQIHVHSLPPEDMQSHLQVIHSTLVALHAQESSYGLGADETPEAPPAPIHWRKSIRKQTVTCLVCGASFKQLSVRHLRVHGLDTRSYRVKYGMPRRQPLSARAVTALRKQIVQRSRPWEKAPTYLKAHEKTQQPVGKKTRLRKAHEPETPAGAEPPKRVSRKRKRTS
jgi:predicted transcriptional regulator